MINLISFTHFSPRVNLASIELQDLSNLLDSVDSYIYKNYVNNVITFEFRCKERFNTISCEVSNSGLELEADYNSLELMGKILELIESRFFKGAKLETKEASKHFLTLTLSWVGDMAELGTDKPTSGLED